MQHDLCKLFNDPINNYIDDYDLSAQKKQATSDPAFSMWLLILLSQVSLTKG